MRNVFDALMENLKNIIFNARSLLPKVSLWVHNRQISNNCLLEFEIIIFFRFIYIIYIYIYIICMYVHAYIYMCMYVCIYRVGR